jgi:6,7-dimethyl-8-ribityllumazine synthase
MAKYDLRASDYEVDGAYIAIVAARFNAELVGPLLDGALERLASHGVGAGQVKVVRVPGAFEIPLAAERLAKSGRYEAVIVLGAVVRGDTPHFEYVAGECARGVAQVSLMNSLPVIFGVLTVDTMEQGLARIGGSEGNKGEEAAAAALEMVTLMRGLA